MKESISIKNLGPLAHVQMDDIKPFVFLIGESASGKSLFMKTLILFRYIYKMLNIRWYLKNSHVNKSGFKLSIGNLLSPELKPYFKNRSLEIVYRMTINGNVHEIAYRNGKIERNNTDAGIPNRDLVFLKESWISETRNIIPYWISQGQRSRFRSLNYYFNETLGDFLAATDSGDRIDLHYIGLDMTVHRKGDSRKFYIAPKDMSYSPVELRFASSGIQTSSSIMVLADYFVRTFSFKDAINRSILSYLYESNSVKLFKPDMEPLDIPKMIHIHVEEPELNLFPDAQCMLIEQLVSTLNCNKASDRSIRIMLASHSPYIINYLNVLIQRDKECEARISPDELGVYLLHEGRLRSLLAVDDSDNRFVDTSVLTNQMEKIMDEYSELLVNSHE